MSVIKHLLWAGILTLMAGACFKAPEFSIVPQIEYQSITFKPGGTGGFDSLILVISFRDGDGDLGLSADETGCMSEDICYNSKFYFVKSDQTFVTYKDKRTNPNFSDLPGFVKPYNCINWEVYRVNNVVQDTLYFELNPDHYNIEIDFLVKNTDGTFTEFDWTTEFDYPNCGLTYDGRFPILYEDRSGSPLEGTIRYGMGSTGFRILFSLKTIKLRVQIKDRALHRSNIIETPEFTL
ncbi:MAG: hypothetical protein KIT62_06490 [Cyclobacteriaceae bacterium]|nr:hypothetical protein [Cyclobacteriaceae bacterium]